MGVVLILGEERFGVRMELADLLCKHPALEESRFTGSTSSPAQILDEVRTPTLAGGRRAVVVDDAGPLLEDAGLSAFAAYAAAPVKGALLVLCAERLDRRFKAAKELCRLAEVVECPVPRADEVRAWLPGWAREAHGLQLGSGSSDALLERVGEDRALLDGQLARLREQIAPRTRLEASDISDAVEAHRSPALFEAASALEEGKLQGALDSLATCFEEGIRFPDGTVLADEGGVGPIVLGQLHRSWVRLTRAHMLRRAGSEDPEIGRALGLSPGAARYFLPRAARHALPRLLERHELFLAADSGLKGGGSLGARRTLEALLIGLLR
ncbi:MAG: DNA polymerase III subunit delta [Planctomycetaceae bacterium]